MRTLVAFATVLALATTGLMAQSHTGDIFSITSSGTLYRTAQDGSSVATLATLPGQGTSHGLALSFDNSTLLVTRSTANFGGILSFDTKTLTLTTMYQTSLFAIREVLVNPAGNPVFTAQVLGASSTLTQYGLFELMPGGSVQTLLIGTAPLDGGLELNMNTGNYLVGHGSFQYGLYDVDASGNVVTLTQSNYNRYSIAQDYTTGDIYSSTYNKVGVLRQGAVNGIVATLAPGQTSYYYAIAMDRASAPQTVLHSRYTTNVYRLDPATLQVASTICPSTSGTHYEMVFEGERNLSSAMAAPGRWDLYLNFPGEAGRPYMIGLSITGYRPPITLPDGRRICLTPDRLTPLAAQGLLAPIFHPGSGQLNTSGRAVATLNVQNLPKTGIPVWFVAITFAGSKIQTISDPYVIKLP